MTPISPRVSLCISALSSSLASCILPRSFRISTLFPYTTLFRSHGKAYRSALVEWITLTPDNLRWTSKHAAHLGQRDRKSTRLNSSHGYISYAVFCLKKKSRRRNDSHLQFRLIVALGTHFLRHRL